MFVQVVESTTGTELARHDLTEDASTETRNDLREPCRHNDE